MNRVTLVRAVIGSFSESYFGISLPRSTPPDTVDVRPLQFFAQGNAERTTALEVSMIESTRFSPPMDLFEPDGNVIFGWHVRAPVASGGGNEFSSEVSVGGEIRWVGAGQEKVLATVSPKHGSQNAHMKIGMLREPALPPGPVTFWAREEHGAYVNATGNLGQRVNPLSYLYVTLDHHAQVDNSPMSPPGHPHLIWMWHMENEQSHHARMCRLETTA